MNCVAACKCVEDLKWAACDERMDSESYDTLAYWFSASRCVLGTVSEPYNSLSILLVEQLKYAAWQAVSRSEWIFVLVQWISGADDCYVISGYPSHVLSFHELSLCRLRPLELLLIALAKSVFKHWTSLKFKLEHLKRSLRKSSGLQNVKMHKIKSNLLETELRFPRPFFAKTLSSDNLIRSDWYDRFRKLFSYFIQLTEGFSASCYSPSWGISSV